MYNIPDRPFPDSNSSDHKTAIDELYVHLKRRSADRIRSLYNSVRGEFFLEGSKIQNIALL